MLMALSFGSWRIEIKQQRGYICDDCGADLSKLRRFLHAHHKNGLQHDNSDENIAVLCVVDHAKQYNHGHVKHTPDYKEYVRLLASTMKATTSPRSGG